MWYDSRRGRNLIKKRYTTRKIRLNAITISLCIVSLLVTTLCIMEIVHIAKQNMYENSKEVAGFVDVYKEQTIDTPPAVASGEVSNPKDVENKNFKLTALGEIMMGGVDNTSYTLPYKLVCEYSKQADYTIANLGTNIVDLETIENSKSKYIVTKDIIKGFNTLGIDAVNISNDHIVDFGANILKGSIKILEDANINVIGREEQIVYAEHDGIRVAFIGINNQIIGTSSNYTNNGIFIYNLKKMVAKIKEASQIADTVVVMEHLGLENEHEVTDVMRWLYRYLIDNGADVVLGSHALGVYPIEIYNSKPIIYSLGNFLNDTTSQIGRKSAMFTFGINVDGKIYNIEVVPTYIYNNSVQLYYEYDRGNSNALLEYMAKDLSKETYTIQNGKLNVKIN